MFGFGSIQPSSGDDVRGKTEPPTQSVSERRELAIDTQMDKIEDREGLNFEVWAAMHQARDTMARCREMEVRPTGLTGTQAAVMWIVKNTTAPPTPAEISRWIFREPHTVSTLLKQMEKQGLVRKIKDLDRKNLVRIEVTKKGEEAFRKSRDGAKAVDDILNCLSDEEAKHLLEYLKMLRSKALEKLGGRKLTLPSGLKL